jgi:hypothetical protein
VAKKNKKDSNNKKSKDLLTKKDVKLIKIKKEPSDRCRKLNLTSPNILDFKFTTIPKVSNSISMELLNSRISKIEISFPETLRNIVAEINGFKVSQVNMSDVTSGDISVHFIDTDNNLISDFMQQWRDKKLEYRNGIICKDAIVAEGELTVLNASWKKPLRRYKLHSLLIASGTYISLGPVESRTTVIELFMTFENFEVFFFDKKD